jgi:hypothetical protein
MMVYHEDTMCTKRQLVGSACPFERVKGRATILCHREQARFLQGAIASKLASYKAHREQAHFLQRAFASKLASYKEGWIRI